MVVNQCDRCKKIFKKNSSTSVESWFELIKHETVASPLNGQSYLTHHTFDLCGKCKEELGEWFRSPASENVPDISEEKS